jgi:serine protease DegQ
MKRTWLLFSQTVTVLLAAYFVVATLKPEWLDRGNLPGVSVIEAPAGNAPRSAVTGAGFASAAKVASAAVVSINTSKAAAKNPHAEDPWFKFFFGDQSPNEPQGGLGSGVIISTSGYILTNNHVVEGADEIEVILNDTRKAKAQIIGTDPDTDLAILKIDLDKLPVIVLGNSDALQVGDPVMAIGNPFGVGQTVTGGIVSALGAQPAGHQHL